MYQCILGEMARSSMLKSWNKYVDACFVDFATFQCKSRKLVALLLHELPSW